MSFGFDISEVLSDLFGSCLGYPFLWYPTWLQLLTSKDRAAAAIKKFKMRAEAKSGKKLRVLRTDRNGEFTSVEFAVYCVDQGVV